MTLGIPVNNAASLLAPDIRSLQGAGAGDDRPSPILTVGDQVITAAEMIPLLARYRLLPQFLREICLEQAIAPFTCADEEMLAATQQFYAQHQIASDRDRQAWLERNQCTLEQLHHLITRTVKLEKFKQATWEHKIESYFLQRKRQLDRAIYSLLRVKDINLAQELFFRIQEGEQSFADLAREHSQGPEAQTGGLIGPTELTTPHPLIAQKLAASQPGQLLPPTRLNEWVVILRLETFLPCQLDTAMRQRLLNELFEAWITEEVNQSLGQVGG